MGSRAKQAISVKKWMLALGAAACALASLSVRADFCRSYFDRVELPPGMRKFLEDEKVEARILSYGDGREPFASFYDAIESWLTLEKGVGRASVGQARLRVPGGEPLFRVYKRNKYALAAKFQVDAPGEVTLVFEPSGVAVPDQVAILDFQTLQLSIVHRLFSAFDAPGEELRKLTVVWKLDPRAPVGFGDHMTSLGFTRSKAVSRCALPTRVLVAVGSTLFGAAAGGFLSIPADDAFYFGDDPYGRIVPWAIGGGMAAGGSAGFILQYACKRPSARAGSYQLAFTRAPAEMKTK